MPDYRDRPPVDAPRVIDAPTRKQVAWFVGSVAFSLASWGMVAVSAGLVSR